MTGPDRREARMTGPDTRNVETVFVFPGQGSQYPGMGRDLAVCGPLGRDLVARAQHITGLPVAELMTRADAAAIADPEVAQVLVFVASIALLHSLIRGGTRPDAVAGHSLGEYSALVAADCLAWEEALVIVHERGRVMAAAARRAQGRMAAVVGLPAERVQGLCSAAASDGEAAVIANHNSRRQMVVSGHAAAVERVVAAALAAGALRAQPLPVGGAFHTPIMRPAERELAESLRRVVLREPRIPLVSSVTGAWVTDLDDYRTLLSGQITAAVRWDASVGTLIEAGARTFVEAGPGRVLTGLGRENARRAKHQSALQALKAAPRRMAAAVTTGTAGIGQ